MPNYTFTDPGNGSKSRIDYFFTANATEYYKEKDDGYLIRSKIKWVEEGEKSTKFFFNLEKSRQSSNVIRQIKDKNGNLQTEDNEILKAASDFYKNLFTTKNIDQAKINEYLNNTNFRNKLTERQKNECDKEITELEIEIKPCLEQTDRQTDKGICATFHQCIYWRSRFFSDHL